MRGNSQNSERNSNRAGRASRSPSSKAEAPVNKRSSRTANTSWGGVSSWYDSLLGEADTYQEQVIAPNLLRLLEKAKGGRILDLACGQGYFSRHLAEAGFRVIGADVAVELIEIAKKKSPGIRFEVAEANRLIFLNDDSCDAVINILAIQNIEDVRSMLSECARVLKPGGALFIVMNHPAFRIPKRSSWGFDEKKGIQYRRIDGYLTETKEIIEMNPGAKGGATTVSFHRPLQSYLKQLNNAGFYLARCEEWTSHKKSEQGPRSKAEDLARKEFPLFLMLEAKLIRP